MKQPGQPSSSAELPTQPDTEVVPPIFRLGDGTHTHEVIKGGKRMLLWEQTEHDGELAHLAGWDVFDPKFHGNVGQLEIPAGTRNSTSVLAATEAWVGEKKVIVETVERYFQDVYTLFSALPKNFSWEQVGITPEQEIFIAPPNCLLDKQTEDINDWKQKPITEIGLLLRNDEYNAYLVDQFAETLQGLDRDDH